MKKPAIAFFAVFVFAHVPLRAQLVVEDVASIAQDAINQVVNLGEYVEMVSNQVEQINKMTQELQQVTSYVKAFGDPASLLEITGVSGLVADLQQSGVGQTIGEIQELAQGTEALKANVNGLYNSVKSISLSGVTVPRPEELYRKFAAIDKAADNYTTVYDDVATRRKALKGEMVATTQKLQSSSTDAETQKLAGVVVGQSAELEAVDREVQFAASQAAMQDISNRSDADKRQVAQSAEIAADRHDAMTKAGAMLVPDVASDILQEVGKR
ncbi:MAG: hypothetical protein ABI680_11115 [Chthoniobacteraceae bacterium]